MSNLSTIYAKMRATIPTLTGFTAKQELADPYTLSNNSEQTLRVGWGIKLGDNNPQVDDFDMPDYVETQVYEVVLTLDAITTSNNPDPLVTASSQIRSDLDVIKDDFMGTRFGIADKVTNITMDSISAIEGVSVDKMNFITASIIFEFLQWR